MAPSPPPAPSWLSFPTAGVTVTYTYSSGYDSSGNAPTHSYDASQAVLTINPCTISSCAGFGITPIVFAQLLLPFTYSKVRGSFVQGSPGGSHPDDCNGGPTNGWTTWSPTPTGHDGFIMLGGPLDSEILYPGCAHGGDYGSKTNTIGETSLQPTNLLRVAVCQSVSTETVSISLGNLYFFGA